MKLKLLLVFIGVVVILLMAGLEIVQGDDVGYPVPIDEGYPFYVPVPVVGYPVEPEPVNNPVIPDSSIEQLEPIEPQYVNGRNLWQEIVYQFSRLLELMK